MYLPSSEAIMTRLRETDLVLDIGGWAHPFNRANYVMDCEPYETRGYYNRTFAKTAPYPPIGGTVERFTRATWIQRDICDKTPYPFADKQLDYVVCAQTLEDIRDPLWVCAEMIRIAKAGYLEVPSRVLESCRGQERGIVGLSHHRWLVDIEDGHVSFRAKSHMIHADWRLSFPASVARRLSERERVAFLFWEDGFSFGEPIIHGEAAQRAELMAFVDARRPYHPLRLRVADAHDRITALKGRAIGKARRIVAAAVRGRSSCP